LVSNHPWDQDHSPPNDQDEEAQDACEAIYYVVLNIEEIEFEDDVKPPLPLGFEKAVDILSTWIHKKFFSESPKKSGSKEERNTRGNEVLTDINDGSEESKIKTSTPARENVADLEFSNASTSKMDDITFDDYEVAEENESSQEKLSESSFDDYRRDIIKRSRHIKPNPKFISDNPEERADIDDPQWEEINPAISKNLTVLSKTAREKTLHAPLKE